MRPGPPRRGHAPAACSAPGPAGAGRPLALLRSRPVAGGAGAGCTACGRRGVTNPAAARGGGNARRGVEGTAAGERTWVPRPQTDRPADGAQPTLAPRAVGVRGNAHAVGARDRRAGSSEAGGDPRLEGEGRASVRRPDGVGGAGALTGSADGLSGAAWLLPKLVFFLERRLLHKRRH